MMQSSPPASPFLMDFGPLSCHCTNAALEGLYKAMADPPAEEADAWIWLPHQNPWISEHIENITARGNRILSRIQDELESVTNINSPQLKKADDPWTPPSAAALEQLRLQLNAIPADRKSIDDWMRVVDYVIQRYLAADVIKNEADYITVRAVLLAKLQAAAEQGRHTPPDTRQMSVLLAALPSNFHALPRDLTPRELNILQFSAQETANHITDLAQQVRSSVKSTLLNGIRAMSMGEPDGTWNKLQQQLFDQFGTYNRDWRRIAITETGNATNAGFISSLAVGTKVRRLEAYRGACPFCASIAGRVLTIVSEDKSPKDWDREVWPTKNNIGRSASPRKRVGNVLVARTDEELWKIPAGLVHPHCRGGWSIAER